MPFVFLFVSQAGISFVSLDIHGYYGSTQVTYKRSFTIYVLSKLGRDFLCQSICVLSFRRICCFRGC